jgi:molybdopterin converting factor small subunit
METGHTAMKVGELAASELLDLDGNRSTLASHSGTTATVLVFIGNGCPTVRSYQERLKALQAQWSARGVKIVAVNANNQFLSPPDTIAEMRARAAAGAFNFAYLKDEVAALARLLGAVCTPHAFLLDSRMEIVYSGRIDDSRVGDTITTRDLENAIDSLVHGRPISPSRTEPFGCSIVW